MYHYIGQEIKELMIITAGREGKRILAEMRRVPLREVAERARILEQMVGVALRNLEGETLRRVEEQRTLVATGLGVPMKASLQEKMEISYQQVHEPDLPTVQTSSKLRQERTVRTAKFENCTVDRTSLREPV
jgi:hypothetical protein